MCAPLATTTGVITGVIARLHFGYNVRRVCQGDGSPGTFSSGEQCVKRTVPLTRGCALHTHRALVALRRSRPSDTLWHKFCLEFFINHVYDEEKNRINIQKHGLSFETTVRVANSFERGLYYGKRY